MTVAAMVTHGNVFEDQRASLRLFWLTPAPSGHAYWKASRRMVPHRRDVCLHAFPFLRHVARGRLLAPPAAAGSAELRPRYGLAHEADGSSRASAGG